MKTLVRRFSYLQIRLHTHTDKSWQDPDSFLHVDREQTHTRPRWQSTEPLQEEVFMSLFILTLKGHRAGLFSLPVNPGKQEQMKPAALS